MDKLYESDYVTCINLAWNHAEEYERAKDEVKKKNHKEKCLQLVTMAREIRKLLDNQKSV